MYKIGFYVPESHLEEVKEAMFLAGAGRIGNYQRCSWQVKGEGQFEPMQGSQSFLGEQGQLEKVEEYRVEMVCAAEVIQAVMEAMKVVHPYEEPAYDVVILERF